MNNDIENLRQEIMNKVDEIINEYVSNDNTMVEIPEDKIYMEITLGDQDYVAFTEDDENAEEISMMFAKASVIEGKRILRNIEDQQEYDRVAEEFDRRLAAISE